MELTCTVIYANDEIKSPRGTMIGLNHKLILHEFIGDWMRMTVEQPDMTCNGLDEKAYKTSVHEGWLKWRDENKTRGYGSIRESVEKSEV